MKHLFTILIGGLILLTRSAITFGQCNGGLIFNTSNDLSPLYPCITSYSGSSTQETFCSTSPQWGFKFQSYTHFIIIGPFPQSGSATFTYYTNNADKFWIQENATGSGSTWNTVDLFNPTINACTPYSSSGSIPAGHYMKISKAFGGGGQSTFAWIREIDVPQPLPVQLVSFQANRTGNSVKLLWKTATEINNYGFEVERDMNNDQWGKIGFVSGSGTVNTPQYYSFTDVPPSSTTGSIRYRLRQIDRDGSSEYSPIVSVFVGKISSFGIINSYPNPFNPTTTITFNLPADSKVSLKILDETGKEVESLVKNELLTAGSYSRIFSGHALISGTYTAWLYTSTESSAFRISLVK